MRLWMALAGAATLVTWIVTERELSRPRDLHAAEHVTSAECRRCHPSHFDSWHRTFHRTMTQDVSEQAVLAPFSGEELAYQGARARMYRQGERFRVDVRHGDGTTERHEVVRAVGSHRYQQYLARQGDTLVRLPVAWNVVDQQWFHMNGAFLTPDPPRPSGAVSRDNFNRHVTRWNDNCVFCHNVAANPGLQPDGALRTEVAELGVACEACHGPAQEHASLNHNPVRRFALGLTGRADPTIVNPGRLSHERAADVCGRCHGQRLTGDIAAFLREGDPFVPGEDLARYSAPLWRDSTLNGRSGLFAPRFWPDGTARLTAYEYQGWLQSPCAQRGELTCTTCHAMHEGDPSGQLRPERSGQAMCVDCHTALTSGDSQRAHSHHDASQAQCVDCHMPRLVYGVLDAHRSHRIESPDPARDAAQGRPDACTGCHTTQSRRWAAAQRQRLWPRGMPEHEPVAETGPEVERTLLAGDPIERALAAHHLGRADGEHGDRGPAHTGLLLDTLVQDPYPAVRRIAWRALRARNPGVKRWPGFDPEGAAEKRASQVQALRRALGPGRVVPPDAEHVSGMRAQAAAVAIEIGE